MTKGRSIPLLSVVTTLLVVSACAGCGDGDKHRTFRDAGAGGVRELIVAARTVMLELAVTPTSRNTGLMNRTSMEPDAGMLFLFPDDKPRTFWMRNTLIPLDIIFLDADGTVQNIEQGQRMAELPGYHSLRPARMVLELNAGWCAQHGLRPGDRIDVPAEWLALPKE